jgi:UDP-N-acetylglucosamine 2-epimerase (non-hydrolysing)
LAFWDYNALQTKEHAVLSDSEAISEDSPILNYPAPNLREVHERPEGFEEVGVIFIVMNIDRVM